MATVTKPILLDETGQQILTAIGNVSIMPQIIDNLTTSDATKALSAKQGKVLNDALNSFETYRLQPSDYYIDYVNGADRESLTTMYKINNIIVIVSAIQIIAYMQVNTAAFKIPKWRPSSNVSDAWCFTRAASNQIYVATYDRWILNPSGDVYTTYEIDSGGALTRYDMFMMIYKI